jgi:hypothetical protein
VHIITIAFVAYITQILGGLRMAKKKVAKKKAAKKKVAKR